MSARERMRGRRLRGGEPAAGSLTVTRVPPSARFSMTNVPASACARSRMPISPSRRRASAARAAAVSMPRPSSSMVRCSMPSRRTSDTVHDEAPLWRATLVSASWTMR